MRYYIKRNLLALFIKFIQHRKVQLYLNDMMQCYNQSLPALHNDSNPYFLVPQTNIATELRSDIVFISSRFRSGSTLLWNLFRQTDGFTSFYEPFNERRWFDSSQRGDQVDSSHRGVDDYWLEYDEIKYLDQFYDENWLRHQLLMTAKVFHPKMQSYINILIEAASRRPVLQFNRVDFRLPWLRHNYPNAKLIHLYRHPRDQWCSFLTDPKAMSAQNVEKHYKDAFYLDVWCDDLAKHFPLLDKRITLHPYRRFYYLWKLSFLYGKTFADISISFESLVRNTKEVLNNLFTNINAETSSIDRLSQLIKAPKLERWKDYASENWFAEHESICESNLTKLLAADNPKLN